MAILNQKSSGPRIEKLDSYQLFQRAISIEGLRKGWHKTRANNGAAGGDNITISMFDKDAEAWLSRLNRSLQSGEYRPGRLRHVDIPKKTGGMRRLSIPCISDRVVQTSVAKLIMPLLDHEFEPESFAYRPGRSVTQAVARVSSAQRAGFDWIIDADIEDFFGTIPHDLLLDRWSQTFSPGRLTDLVELWLTYAAPQGRGVAQGSPLSPVLANLFLDRLDERFQQGRYRFVRFADDFVILAKSRDMAEQAKVEADLWLSSHGLRLNKDKSRILQFDQGLKFLGHLFVNSLVTKSFSADQNEDVLSWMRQLAREDKSISAQETAKQTQRQEEEAAGYSSGFKVLYVHEAGRRLNFRNRSFTVEAPVDPVESGSDFGWLELIAINHNQIDRIDIGPKARLSEGAQALALATDTPIAFVGGSGQTKGWISPDLAPRAARHMAQARFYLDTTKRLDLASKLVMGRIRTQRAVLRRLSRKQDNKIVLDSLTGLNRLIGRGDASRVKHAKSIEQLMGYEGEAGQYWWRAISALMPLEFRFKARRAERPAQKPAQAIFDFLSWQLNRDISVAVSRASLHPGFGVLHSAGDYKNACIYDLMEPFRAHFIGGLAVFCVNKKLIQMTDFQTQDRKGILKTTGQAALIRAYENRISRVIKSPLSGRRMKWRHIMLEQAQLYAAQVEDRAVFEPIDMDY